MTFEALPPRVIDRDELHELVSVVAARPELWRRFVAFSDQERHFVSLHRDAHVDVWVICWTPRNDTGWHDHDVSSGAVAVVEGELVEHHLAVLRDSTSRAVRAGAAFSFGADYIHRLTGHTPGAVSIHAYSPPLWRMGQYAVDRDGLLHRTSVSYADELRPVDDEPAVGDLAASTT
jgi:quercetin dioxygenase-like cupin family protein